MALIVRNLCVVQIITLLFAGSFCETTACLDFGLGCWGGHGKRNNIQATPTMHILTDKTLLNDSPQNDKTLWILSRISARRATLPMTYENRAKWKGSFSDKTHDSKWQTALVNNENIEPIRFPFDNKINEKEITDVQDTVRVTNENLESIPEILLISSNDKPITSQKVDLLKFLNEANGI